MGRAVTRVYKLSKGASLSYKAALHVMAGGTAQAAAERYGVSLAAVYARVSAERARLRNIWPEDEVTL